MGTTVDVGGILLKLVCTRPGCDARALAVLSSDTLDSLKDRGVSVLRVTIGDCDFLRLPKRIVPRFHGSCTNGHKHRVAVKYMATNFSCGSDPKPSYVSIGGELFVLRGEQWDKDSLYWCTFGGNGVLVNLI